MIRVPFSSLSDARPSPDANRHSLRADGSPTTEKERVEMIEARLATLELKLVSHAEELKLQVSERVLRIQSRLENAMKPFQSEVDSGETGEGADNVVAFVTDEKHLHHLHATNACEALNDLNQTLRLTREHLEALANSVDRMRQIASKR
ncbi:MAG: hypothetical protein KA152_05165 [Verrucomicrobiales bacterium]|nr:hypothetical protein [Verrucomicrobiales bacterium]